MISAARFSTSGCQSFGSVEISFSCSECLASSAKAWTWASFFVVNGWEKSLSAFVSTLNPRMLSNLLT